MREPADRWELQDVPDTNDGDMISKRAVLDILYLDPGIDEIREKMIKELPSAQPEGTSGFCLYRYLEWDEEPCDSCTMGGTSNHYKPSTQPEIIRCRNFLDQNIKKGEAAFK